MNSPQPILEGPTPGPLHWQTVDHRARRNEPLLEADQIQGNILPGFLKDHQSLLFLRIVDPAAFAVWLGRLVPTIATMEEVVAFNRLFKSLRSRRDNECNGVKTTWINVAFSFAGLRRLKSLHSRLNLAFRDAAFRQGLWRRSLGRKLGDPAGTGTEGDAVNWRVGGPRNDADLVVIVAGDDRDDLFNEVARIERSIFLFTDGAGRRLPSGVEIVFKQDGATLTGPLNGHEHFGFRDGISQPGVRGKLADGSFLTPGQNPRDANQGKPGQDLLWPGEFVFGYPGQDPRKEVEDAGADPLGTQARGAPAWARNGSLLVFRRLRQDVAAFHRFLRDVGRQFQTDPDEVGAKLVGRWASGAPTVSSPTQDDPRLAADDCRNNNFEFAVGDAPTSRTTQPGDCPDVQPPANDPAGDRCPLAAHIRKAYPRNDTDPSIPDLKEETTQTHRMLRRGIPYGAAAASTPHAPQADDVDRGLLFLAYQVSIVEQFEFVTRSWANDPNFKASGAGHDPIIGQNDKAPNRTRTFRINLPGALQPLSTDEDWVIPTGGGYYFAPSIAALQMLASRPTPKTPARKKPSPRKKPSRLARPSKASTRKPPARRKKK